MPGALQRALVEPEVAQRLAAGRSRSCPAATIPSHASRRRRRRSRLTRSGARTRGRAPARGPSRRPLHVQRRGRQQVAVGHVRVRARPANRPRDDRLHAVGADHGRAGGVGDVGDDLHAAPQPRGARAGDTRAGRGRAPPARCRARTPACASSASSDSEALGSVEDLQLGSSPHHAPARRPCARRRRSCRGAARRRRGRARAPCRTRWPSTPS